MPDQFGRSTLIARTDLLSGLMIYSCARLLSDTGLCVTFEMMDSCHIWLNLKSNGGKCGQIVAFVAMLWLLLLNGPGFVFAQSSPPTPNVDLKEKALLLAARREPGNAQIVGSLGEYYLQKEKWQQSARWLSKAYTLSNADVSIGYDLAFAFLHAGELESAKGQIQQMLVRTDSAELHSLLAAVEDRRGNYVDAAKEYHRSAELEPTDRISSTWLPSSCSIKSM